MKKLSGKSGRDLEKVDSEQRKIGWAPSLWSRVRRGTWLGNLHKEYDQFEDEISMRADEFRQRIAQISHRLAYVSGGTDREKYEFYDPAQDAPEGKTLADRIANLVNEQTKEFFNGQASVAVPALVTNGHGVFPQVSEADEIDFRKVEVDREPVALFQRVIDQLWHQLYDRFQLVEEFLGQVLNEREDYLRMSKEINREAYKTGKINELEQALQLMSGDIFGLERYLNIMESYLKTAYFINKVDECLETQGEPSDFDLILDPYYELKKHFQSLAGLLRISKYDEIRVQVEMRTIEQIRKQMTDLELRRFERSERVNEQIAEAGKVIASLQNTFKMLSQLGARAGEEFSSQVGGEIKEILAQLDEMVMKLKESPALIDKGVIQKWFSEQLDKIREIEKRCEEIGLSGILPSKRAVPAIVSAQRPLLQPFEGKAESVADVLFNSVLENFEQQEDHAKILELIMGLHSHKSIEWRLKLAKLESSLWPAIAASFAGINPDALNEQQCQELDYIRTGVWRNDGEVGQAKVLISLLGDDSDAAWVYRNEIDNELKYIPNPSAPRTLYLRALLESIYGSEDERAWKMRNKYFFHVNVNENIQLGVLNTLCGISSNEASDIRLSNRNQCYPRSSMQSLAGVEDVSGSTFVLRWDSFKWTDFDFRNLGISLAGIFSARDLRQELYKRGEYEALAYALAGDFSPEADELRELLQRNDQVGFETILKSYTGGGNLIVLAVLKKLGILDKYFG